jgi:hypothetical protein
LVGFLPLWVYAFFGAIVFTGLYRMAAVEISESWVRYVTGRFG